MDQGGFRSDVCQDTALAKLECFDTPLSGDIEIAVDEESDENGQVVHIPLVFQPEAFEEVIEEYTTELEGGAQQHGFQAICAGALSSLDGPGRG